MAKIVKDDIDRFYDYEVYAPTRTIYMGSVENDIEKGESGVDGAMAERVIKALHILDQKDEPITIIMNNVGGDWFHGMAIYDAIKACKSHITIKTFGHAMSMGAVILQAADQRVLAPNSKVMIHYGYASFDGHSKTFQKWAKEFENIDEEMEKIFLEKIRQKHPTYKKETLEGLLNHDTILTAQDAVNLGLADEVL